MAWLVMLCIHTFLCALPPGLAFGIVDADGEGEASDGRYPGAAIVITSIVLAFHSFDSDPLGPRWPIWLGLFISGMMVFVMSRKESV